MRECDRVVSVANVQLKRFLWCDRGGRMRESPASRVAQKLKSRFRGAPRFLSRFDSLLPPALRMAA
jgi:hypothetical protein